MTYPSKAEQGSANDSTRGIRAGEIANALRLEIVSGALPQDSELRQQALAVRFGVSRMPVREAMRMLEAEGFVVFHPNRSARVAPQSIDDLEEIYEMRIAAETLAIRLAIPELTNAQITRAQHIHEQMEIAEISETGTLNTSFHLALYTPCARPRLLAHIEALGRAADRYLRLTFSTLDYAAKSHEEHRELLKHCSARNHVAAQECLARHIGDAGRALADVMSKTLKGA